LTSAITNIKSGYEETIKLLQTKISTLQDVVRKGYEEFDTHSKVRQQITTNKYSNEIINISKHSQEWVQNKRELESKNADLQQAISEMQSKMSR
jgi:hypothetical protein